MKTNFISEKKLKTKCCTSFLKNLVGGFEATPTNPTKFHIFKKMVNPSWRFKFLIRLKLCQTILFSGDVRYFYNKQIPHWNFGKNIFCRKFMLRRTYQNKGVFFANRNPLFEPEPLWIFRLWNTNENTFCSPKLE